MSGHYRRGRTTRRAARPTETCDCRPTERRQVHAHQHLARRAAVGDRPGSGHYRDSISVEWQWREKPVRLIDTAGLRKRAKVVSKLERLSAADTQRAVDFAEVVVLLLDATLGLEGQDLRIADRVLQEGRALVIALNKWDALPDQQTQGAMYRGVTTALADGLAGEGCAGAAGLRPDRTRARQAAGGVLCNA
ncbi:GTPase [Hankyongella ginsenosidimutans]|uniref:GTPase n=1 Tax=Hankyongella ginsenosidimutans TaxID=1763828 RepID=UPI001FE43BD2|nr:GTPase [Hankyongella ginsenosidimutans]